MNSMRAPAPSLRLHVVLTALLAVTALASLGAGPVPLSPGDILDGLGGGSSKAAIIIQEIRLPRLLLAALVGAGLAASGAALQGLIRNPLADPGVTGISSSAALGAVIAIYFGVGSFSPALVPVMAFAGAFAAALVLVLIAAREASTLTLILAGVAISSLAVALTSLALGLAPNPYALAEFVNWLLGSLKNRSMDDVVLAAPVILAGIVLLFLSARGLDALTLGEETAATLGVRLVRLRVLVVTGTALCVGGAVAAAGGVGFVGLIVPHLIRPFAGHVPGRLVVPSAIGGAALVIAADLVVRLAPTGSELMLGVVTALIGAPFFFWLLFATRRLAP